MHAISSYRGNRPTNKQTNPQTEPITIHCAAASAQCNEFAIHHVLRPGDGSVVQADAFVQNYAASRCN